MADVICGCPFRHLLPVCGTDGTTFNNECLLKAATCRDKSITKEHDGECQPEKAQMAGNIYFLTFPACF